MNKGNVLKNDIKDFFHLVGTELKKNRLAVLLYTALSVITLVLISVYFHKIAIDRFWDPDKAADIYVDQYDNYIMHWYRGVLGTAVSAIGIIASFMFSLLAFNYLHNKRIMDITGSLPVKKHVLFYAKYFTVLVESIVPMVIAFAGSMIFAETGTESWMIFKSLVILACVLFFNVSLLSFICACNGSLSNSVIRYCLVNTVVPALLFVIDFFPRMNVPGLDPDSIFGVHADAVYSVSSPVIGAFMGNYSDHKIAFVLMWLIMGLVFCAADYFVVKFRKNDITQTNASVPFVRNIAIFIEDMVAGIGTGWVLSYISLSYVMTLTPIVPDDFTYYEPRQIISFLLGFVLGSFIWHIICHAIHEHSAHGFLKSLRVYGAACGVALAFWAVCVTGLFGYSTRVPDANEVKRIRFYASRADEDGDGVPREFDLLGLYTDEPFDENEVRLPVITDPQTIETITGTHKNFAETLENYGFWPVPRRDMKSQETVYICYELDDGSTLKRVYCDRELNAAYFGDFPDGYYDDAELLQMIGSKGLKQISIVPVGKHKGKLIGANARKYNISDGDYSYADYAGDGDRHVGEKHVFNRKTFGEEFFNDFTDKLRANVQVDYKTREYRYRMKKYPIKDGEVFYKVFVKYSAHDYRTAQKQTERYIIGKDDPILQPLIDKILNETNNYYSY